MPKEKSINPAQAQRKAEKAKQIKKGKAEAASRRTDKLARKNPQRLQNQLDDLKSLQEGGGKLTSHEQKVLEELERDLKAVKKARETLGDKAPTFGSRDDGNRGGRENGRGGSILGKRRRDGFEEVESDDSDVPEDVKSIPMPRDTPPPVPRDVLDKWHQARRARLGYTSRGGNDGKGTSSNNIPIGDNARRGPHQESERDQSGPPPPKVEAKTVYEAAPAIRDLRKEAASAFIPAAVRLKMEKSKGVGGLVGPEEADRLEREGYLATRKSEEQHVLGGPRPVMMEEVEDEDD